VPNEPYRKALLRCGVGVSTEPRVIAKLCRRFTASARGCLLAGDVNLVAAADPNVAIVMREGIMRDGSLLVLPPDAGVLDSVRDALWFEADSVVRHWARGTRRILAALADATRGTHLALGPRSPICHQDKIVASTPPGDVFDADRPAGLLRDHEHDAWSRVRVQLEGAGLPRPSFVAFDLCRTCGRTASATTRLGLAIMDSLEHAHNWTSFAAPVPDPHGVVATIVGSICLARTGSGERSGRCLATKDVSLSAGRQASMPPLPAWVAEASSVLRPGLACGESHVHLWERGRVALGGGVSLLTVRCVLCDAEYWSDTVHGESAPELMRELRRRTTATGGFSKAPPDTLLEIQAAMQPRWGPYLGWFGDALAMIVGNSGVLREATELERERAADYAMRGREIDMSEAADFMRSSRQAW